MDDPDSDEKYVVRPVRAEEWANVKALRLLALQDPLAHLAFVETHASAAAEPDTFWQDRTARASEGASDAQQIVAVTPSGEWVGTVTVLVEEPGTTDWAGVPVEQRQAQIVGVYVHPNHRGSGLAQRLFAAALTWSWQSDLQRVRLMVHEHNDRAHAMYLKAGFTATGVTVPVGTTGNHELELELPRPSP